jgi:hypothetical protein
MKMRDECRYNSIHPQPWHQTAVNERFPTRPLHTYGKSRMGDSKCLTDGTLSKRCTLLLSEINPCSLIHPARSLVTVFKCVI